MDESNKKMQEYIRRLMLARMALLCNNGFYGLLLMHVKMGLTTEYKTSYTNGKVIYFNPDFLDSISDKELEYVLNHEIMHIVLRHLERKGDNADELIYNIASDIVVNSNILKSNKGDESSITLSKYGVGEHLTPYGDEGSEYSVEEVYGMLEKAYGKQMKKEKDKQKNPSDKNEQDDNPEKDEQNPKGFDYHKKDTDRDIDEAEYEHRMWMDYIKTAAETVKKRRILNGSNACGDIPECIERDIDKYQKPQTDWRTVLNEFVQEEITDYSFMPPDRRFDDSPFFLPDFNEKEDLVKDILFFIDTSGSMSDKMINYAYSEIKGAIDQFDGKLTGWLGFFDAKIVPPVRFEDEDEFKIIRPFGGGGTNFEIIFKYVQEKMEEPPASIIILTAGYAPFPKEEEAMDIPVLWLLNNDKVNPPWGRVTRIEVD